jgi:RsiW-degrading membrane proteinase PrsW (M82 family)
LFDFLIIAAVAPALFLLIKVYKEDKLEKEPLALLLRLVLAGVISTLLASLCERVGSWILRLFFGEETLFYNILFYFIVVGVSEEGAKYILLKYRTWRSPHFNCQFDGVVYAVFISLGFALWENIGYVLSYGMATALVRAVTAVPGHACFGVFMGVWYGAAKKYELAGLPEKSKALRRRAVIIPTLLHGLYDFIATLASDAYSIIFIVFVIIMFVSAYITIKRAAKSDSYIL